MEIHSFVNERMVDREVNDVSLVRRRSFLDKAERRRIFVWLLRESRYTVQLYKVFTNPVLYV